MVLSAHFTGNAGIPGPTAFEAMFAGMSRCHQIGLLSPAVKEILQAQCYSPVTQPTVCAGLHDDLWIIPVGFGR